jgi:hypothetical protein
VSLRVVPSKFQWLHRGSSEWNRVLSILHEFCQHLVSVEVNELLGNHFIPKLFFQHGGVGLADPE